MKNIMIIFAACLLAIGCGKINENATTDDANGELVSRDVLSSSSSVSQGCSETQYRTFSFLDGNADGKMIRTESFNAIIRMNGMLKYLSGYDIVQGKAVKRVATPQNLAEYDVNRDGDITPLDVLILNNMVSAILGKSRNESSNSTMIGTCSVARLSAYVKIGGLGNKTLAQVESAIDAYLLNAILESRGCSKTKYRTFSFLDSNADGTIFRSETVNAINRMIGMLNYLSRYDVVQGKSVKRVATPEILAEYDVNSDGYISPTDVLVLINMTSAILGRSGNESSDNAYYGNCSVSRLSAYVKIGGLGVKARLEVEDAINTYLLKTSKNPVPVARAIAVIEEVGTPEVLSPPVNKACQMIRRKISFRSGKTPFVDEEDTTSYTYIPVDGKFSRYQIISNNCLGVFDTVTDIETPVKGTSVYLEVINTDNILTMKHSAVIPITISGSNRPSLVVEGLTEIFGFDPDVISLGLPIPIKKNAVYFAWEAVSGKYESYAIDYTYGTVHTLRPFGNMTYIPLEFDASDYDSYGNGLVETIFVIGYDKSGLVSGLGVSKFKLVIPLMQ